MQNGFLVTFPSSTGEPCFLVTPERVGQSGHPHYPWARATFVGTLFATPTEAQAALDLMKGIHNYMAPEVNGGLTKRLWQAQIVPSAGVVGIEFETR
jgi:hypothetical protein